MKIFYICLLVFFLSFFTPTLVVAKYDPLSTPNNYFGIHVLDTDEIEKAAKFVNSSSGAWGYVTIPIRANDRDLQKWEKFMEDCARLKIIPIFRIASYPDGEHWVAPNEWDLVDFANFLNELKWPTRNRYVIIYNEPNHKNEWGGFVYPEEYARVLSRAADIFHKKHEDFFVIGAGMDSSAPTGGDSLNVYEYFRRMDLAVPGIFKEIDGMSYHAYGNPAFSTPPNLYSPVNIAGFRSEASYLQSRYTASPKIFITEAGWLNAYQHYDYAFKNVWKDNVVAVTPFLLSASAGPFEGFSFTKQNGDFYDFAKDLMNISKTEGRPQMALDLKFENKPYQVATPPTNNFNLDVILDFLRRLFQ